MNETEIDQIEISIENANKVIELAKEADKLARSRGFKKVILEAYMRDEASRLAGMLAEPSMMSDVDQRELQSALKAIGHLRQFLINLHRQGIMLSEQVKEDQEEIANLRAEEE